MKKMLICLLCLVLALCLCSCNRENQQTQLTMVVTEDTISQLDEYPNLKFADLSGSTCYEAIVRYIASHPQVEVSYTVALGGATVNSTMEALVLPQGSFSFDQLLANIRYLPRLKSLTLPATELTADQVGQLRSTYPALDIQCTVKLQGVEIGKDATSVDLSQMDSAQLQQVIDKLKLMPNIVSIQLMDANGVSKLPLSDVKLLQEALPHVTLGYSFQLFGQTVSTADEAIRFEKVDIGNEGEAAIREALSLLKNCKYFLLDDCGLDNEVMASIRDDFPGTEVVWRIFHVYPDGHTRNWLTDTEVLRAVYYVNDSNSGVFKYLTKVKYVDLGHNNDMHDLSFLSYMPDLEIAILSGSEITDLSPLANSKKLEFLELAWCGWLKDISPLAGCESLKYLNLGHTRVSDLSALQGLPLEMLSYVDSGRLAGLTQADWQAIQGQFPNCWVTYSPLSDANANPYGKGWRYQEDNSYTPAYKKVRDVFELDKIDDIIQGGGNNTTDKPDDPGKDDNKDDNNNNNNNNGGGTSYTPPAEGNGAVEKLTLVVTDATIADLEKYTNLKQADLSGSACYAAIANYIARHPGVRVLYTVSLGKTTVKHSVTTLSLEEGKYSFDSLLANLKYLPELTDVTFPDTKLSAQQLDQLKKAYPGLDFHYTMATQATQANADITSVDLSALTYDQVVSQLDSFPNVRFVKLSSGLSIAEVKALQNAYPLVTFQYSFTLGGKTLCTTDERVEFRGVTLTGLGAQNIRDALDILDSCTYFLLDNNTQAINNDTMAAIRDSYPHIKVVWRVYHDAINTMINGVMVRDSLLTDTHYLRAVYGVNDSNVYLFKYLTDVRYVDLGHNDFSDLSFMGYMPDLEIAILSGSSISDLSPLAACKKLEFLEIAWCGYVKDISPLAGCDSLKYLNISHTRVSDLSSLYGLDMQMIKYVNSGNRAGFTAADWSTIQAELPNCWITWDPLYDNNADPYAVGWRAKPGWKGWTYIYARCREVFEYDKMG